MRALLLFVIAACASPAPPPRAAPPSPPPPPADAPRTPDAAPDASPDASPDAPVARDAPDAPIDAPLLDAAPLQSLAPTTRATIGKHGCPTTFDANALECTKEQQVCHYPQGGCICMPHCNGGAKVRPLAPGETPPGPRWECFPTEPRTDGCPAKFPSGRCTGDRQCSYGPLETGRCWGATVRCERGRWTEVRVAPPP